MSFASILHIGPIKKGTKQPRLTENVRVKHINELFMHLVLFNRIFVGRAMPHRFPRLYFVWVCGSQGLANDSVIVEGPRFGQATLECEVPETSAVCVGIDAFTEIADELVVDTALEAQDKPDDLGGE
jgi:hypothetical protein